MTLKQIAEKAAEIIFANEGGYGSVAMNDNGALSIGIVQWHGGRALTLMKDICTRMGSQKAQECLGKVLYEEIIAKGTNWSTRKATEGEAAKIKAALTSEEGKKAQDEMAAKDAEGYCKHIQNLGVKDLAAIIFMADIENQGGAGASKRIIENSSGKSLDALYASAKEDRVFKNYTKRRDAVYEKVKNLSKGDDKMAVTIGHASIDENGTITGRTAGDQTGKEICTRSWYSKPWNVYVEPLDAAMAERAATYMEQICADDNYGYSQPNRWKGYNSIINNGRKVKGGRGDFDCSSLVLACYILAGLSIAATGYTGNMVSILVGTGKFKAHRDSAHVSSDAYAQRGGVYVNEGSHTAMALSNGSKAAKVSGGSGSAAANNQYAGKGIGTATAKTNMNVRTGSSTESTSIGGVNKGASVEVLEQLSNGWYKIVWPGASCGYAYTSNRGGQYYTFVKNGGSSGNASLKPVSAKSFSKGLAGKYKTTAPLNMRAKPGELKADNIIMEIPAGKNVQNYGYYTIVSGIKWLYVEYDGKVGFSSSEYLKKQ